jgi:CheY-like chemotaxis protein
LPVAAVSSAAASSAAVADLDATSLDPAGFEDLSSDPAGADATGVEIIGADGVALTSASARLNALGANHRPRALVVDDDPEIRRALARLLRPELDVHLAGSVAQAEAALARLDRVDVAFIDWELPDGTGEQILERLAHWPDAIRVLISARVVSSENPLKNRALANLVLGKPLALGVVDALKRAALALPHG